MSNGPGTNVENDLIVADCFAMLPMTSPRDAAAGPSIAARSCNC